MFGPLFHNLLHFRIQFRIRKLLEIETRSAPCATAGIQLFLAFTMGLTHAWHETEVVLFIYVHILATCLFQGFGKL